jgi:predicted DNA-binding protein
MAKKCMTYSLPEELIDNIKKIADSETKSQSDIVRECIEKEMKRRGIK